MKIAFFKSTATATFICSSLITHAQLTSKYAFGINAGTFIYQGDLTPSAIGSFRTPSFVIGFNASRYVTNKFSARLDINPGRLKGDDAAYKTPAWRQERNFAFKTPATELIASIIWDALGRQKRFSPYVFAGLGYSFLKIKRDYSNFNTEYFAAEPGVIEGLTDDINTRLPRGLPIVPAGLGIRYQLNHNFSITTEASYRYISSDYLDGFSQAANPAKKDHYYKFSVGLTYSRSKKNKELDCPVVRW